MVTTTDLTLNAEAFADGKKVGADSCPASWRDNHLVLNLAREKTVGARRAVSLRPEIYADPRRSEKRWTKWPATSACAKFPLTAARFSSTAKRVFQRLILDQGFYPDGIWTAPTDDELKSDIERSMAAGFNGARLHQKVFEPRYLYWADKLGYLVWGEFPNWGFNYQPDKLRELTSTNGPKCCCATATIRPSLAGVPSMNRPAEAGELQQIIWRETKAIDPTRPVLETSGWAAHPSTARSARRP